MILDKSKHFYPRKYFGLLKIIDERQVFHLLVSNKPMKFTRVLSLVIATLSRLYDCLACRSVIACIVQ